MDWMRSSGVCCHSFWLYSGVQGSLLKVDGFNNPQSFEKFVYDANIKANLLLKEKDPEKFTYKYGKDATERSLMKQT